MRDSTYLIGNQFAVGSGPNRTSFKAGFVPWNKGIKRATSPKSLATAFKPGLIPKNKVSVGTITARTDKSGKKRRWIKASEKHPSWVLYSQWVWIKHRGPVPDGMVVHHKDGDSMNDRIENYEIVTRSAHINLHRMDLKQRTNVTAGLAL